MSRDIAALSEATEETETLRRAMRGAVLEIERARGRLRHREPNEAVSAWSVLVSREWSLVDQFDHQGARYYVARRNRPQASAAPPLSEREAAVAVFLALGHSNKLIGYELGIATSTVSTHVRGLMNKLGVHTRAELIHRARRL